MANCLAEIRSFIAVPLAPFLTTGWIEYTPFRLPANSLPGEILLRRGCVETLPGCREKGYGYLFAPPEGIQARERERRESPALTGRYEQVPAGAQ
jgi:hypothetical protein